MEVNCIVLAGGKSIRFGHDKILERIGETSLLEKVISHLTPIGKDIIIVTAEARTLGPWENHPKIKIVHDIFPGQGSLGGIYTGLVKSDSFYNLVVAADMPFLNEDLLRNMINAAEDYDLTIPHVDDMYEPLHAVYTKNCITPIKNLLDRGRKVIIELFGYVNVNYIEDEVVDRFDPRHISFFNINTQEDMKKAQELIRESGAC